MICSKGKESVCKIGRPENTENPEKPENLKKQKNRDLVLGGFSWFFGRRSRCFGWLSGLFGTFRALFGGVVRGGEGVREEGGRFRGGVCQSVF